MTPQEREAPPGALVERLRRFNRTVDAALAEVGRLVSGRQFADARARLLRCVAGWEQQVRLEEEVLYPLFELRLGTAGVGTAAMREEHRDLRQVFEALDLALETGRRPRAIEVYEKLLTVLGSHFSREERVVYPTLDAMLTDRERGRLLTRVETDPSQGPSSAGAGPSPAASRPR